MPTSVTSTSNYVGKAAGRIVGAAFKEADTINKGAINVLQGVNYQESLRRIRYTDGTQAYSCGFTPAGAIVLNERTVTPVKLKNDGQVCKETFRNQWGEDLMGLSAWNQQLGRDIKDAVIMEIQKATAERTDNLIWNGNSSNPDEWDGFITLFGSDGDVIIATDGTPVGAAVSKSNVVTAFENATALIPISLRRKNLIFAISPDVELAYTHYLAANGLSNGLGGDANTALRYVKYQLTTINGLPANTILIYERENLVFATGLMGDHNMLSVVDEDEIGLLTGQVRYKMVYNGGCQYYNSEDIIYYDISAS